MNPGELLALQYTRGHAMLQGVLAEVTPGVANAGGMGTTGSIASVFAHVVFAEDTIFSRLTGAEQIYESGGWAARCGLTSPGLLQTADWAKGVEMDPAVFGDYAKAVFGRSEAYLATLTEADLDREVPALLGDQPTKLANVVAVVGIIHVLEHTGEIAALKGVRGLKGLPF